MAEHTIRIVELNNSSRKGTYVYIRKEGCREAYYKWKPGNSLDSYKKLYDKKLEGKLPPTTTLSSPRVQHPRLPKHAVLEQHIRKGETETRLNLYSSFRPQIENAYKELLEPLVEGTTWKRVAAQANKFNHRFDYFVEFTGEPVGGGMKTTLGNIRVIGGATPEVFIDKMKLLFPTGTRITSNKWGTMILDTRQQFPNAQARQVVPKGWILDGSVVITFRKSK